MPKHMTGLARRSAACAVLLGLASGLAAVSAAGIEPGGQASFVDPTAELSKQGTLELSGRVYVAPFARMEAAAGRRVRIGERANVQDNAVLRATNGDIELGERAIIAHGAVVEAAQPARIAAETSRPDYRNPGTEAIERYMAAHPGTYGWGAVPAFIGFNAWVDGAVISDGSMVMHLARVDPGVTLKSGMKVLAGKRVRTQEEAENPAVGKVEYLTEADMAFMDDVVEVNTALAAGYSGLAHEDASLVRGIGYNPGGLPGNERRVLPAVGGVPTQQPDTGRYKFRIIGNVQIADIRGLRDGVSLRADEGPEIVIGSRGRFLGGNTLHALLATKIAAGSRVTLHPGAIVHGGSGPHLAGGNTTEIGDGSRIGSRAVVFRSKLGKGVKVGENSLVTDSVLPDGTVVPEREVWGGGKKLYSVEW
ncbi:MULTISPECIES: LbetaH domain-containing protein [Paenibacillus]|uniref:hypothetical protein n=1 Tax=Paenibacillus TaxID=44249 RepID=UPI0022B85E7A|nr:hypothetical protein [Paenibacillus caseinilyticus]MCZ8521025.1 hypothetical protein [Paenibacillus caseinilyticus]